MKKTKEFGEPIISVNDRMPIKNIRAEKFTIDIGGVLFEIEKMPHIGDDGRIDRDSIVVRYPLIEIENCVGLTIGNIKKAITKYFKLCEDGLPKAVEPSRKFLELPKKGLDLDPHKPLKPGKASELTKKSSEPPKANKL